MPTVPRFPKVQRTNLPSSLSPIRVMDQWMLQWTACRQSHVIDAPVSLCGGVDLATLQEHYMLECHAHIRVYSLMSEHADVLSTRITHLLHKACTV